MDVKYLPSSMEINIISIKLIMLMKSGVMRGKNNPSIKI